MTSHFRYWGVLLTVAVFWAIGPASVLAYGGPGSVISGIGAFLAAVAAILATVFGFLWFPLKRLYKRMTKEETKEETAAGQQSE
jgi:preprotein translocase subunit SecG